METARIRVSLPPTGGDRDYDILVRGGILGELGGRTAPLPHASSFHIVTDANVGKIYAKALRAALTRHGARAEIVTFPPGEANKNIKTALAIASRLSELGADRRSLLFALGGGIVGDLTGFVASIYKRGVGYVQVPTTLLAQVDSSIGGKTGVNARWGKNQLGTFFQPSAVFTDPLTLRTLPRPEYLNGLAEVVKCAIIADRNLFDRLAPIVEGDSSLPPSMIADVCRIKAEIVSKDEKEGNLRAVLNYGHTVGHALESASRYRLRHGECVVFGMLAEGWIARRLGVFRERDFEKQSELLRKLSRGIGKSPSLSKRALFRFASSDKKTLSSGLRMSLPEELGRMHKTDDGGYGVPVPRQTFEDSIDYLREVLSDSRRV